MSDDQREQRRHVEVVPGSAAPLSVQEEAIFEAGQRMMAESNDVSKDFAKQMITVSSAAIPVYLALLQAIGLSHRSRTAILLVSLPSLALLLSILLFVVALLPRTRLVSLEVISEIRDVRDKIIRARYRWLLIGLAVFSVAVLSAIASMLVLMSE